MFGYNRKDMLKLIHELIELHYGSYNELLLLTPQEISDIQKVLKSIEQQKTIEKAGLK